MQIIYIIALTIILLFIKKIERTAYSPHFLFTLIWIIVFTLSSIRLYDLKETSFHAYTVAFFGVLFFDFGCVVRKRIRVKNPINIVDYKSECSTNYAFLFIFYTIVLIFTSILAVASISLIRSGFSMKSLRTTYDDVSSGLVITNNLMYQFETYIVTPAEFAAVALLPVIFSDVRNRKRFLLAIELVAFLVLHMMVTGARSFIVDIIILFVVYFMINKDFREKFKNYYERIPKFVFYIIGIGSVVLIFFVTTLRVGSEESIFRTIYRYPAISMPLLDTHLNLLDESQEYTYGWTIIYGVVRPWFSFLHNVGVPFPSGLEKAIELVNANNNYYPVGGGWANSFVSVFYYECMDFGLIGIPIFSFLYGGICEKYYLILNANPNRRNQALYLLIAIGIVLSFVRQFFTAFRYVYAFVIICISFKSQKNSLNRLI